MSAVAFTTFCNYRIIAHLSKPLDMYDKDIDV